MSVITYFRGQEMCMEKSRFGGIGSEEQGGQMYRPVRRMP